jgi:hypothetical protein
MVKLSARTRNRPWERRGRDECRRDLGDRSGDGGKRLAGRGAQEEVDEDRGPEEVVACSGVEVKETAQGNCVTYESPEGIRGKTKAGAQGKIPQGSIGMNGAKVEVPAEIEVLDADITGGRMTPGSERPRSVGTVSSTRPWRSVGSGEITVDSAAQESVFPKVWGEDTTCEGPRGCCGS